MAKQSLNRLHVRSLIDQPACQPVPEVVEAEPLPLLDRDAMTDPSAVLPLVDFGRDRDETCGPPRATIRRLPKDAIYRLIPNRKGSGLTEFAGLPVVWTAAQALASTVPSPCIDLGQSTLGRMHRTLPASMATFTLRSVPLGESTLAT